jgi:RNA polymerase sigma factor (sigma-70 family)
VVLIDDDRAVEAFAGFFKETEPRLRQALSAVLGSETGREAAADALAYAWEHWPKVSVMENPVGYLFVYGRGRGRDRLRRRRVAFTAPDPISIPDVEPGLTRALGRLPERQRTTVMLLHCFEWSMSEVADLLGLSKTTVQNHAERGMARLRRSLGVDP